MAYGTQGSNRYSKPQGNQGQQQPSDYEVLGTLANIQKNSFETIRLQKCKFKGKEYLQIQVFKKNEAGEEEPKKNSSLMFNPKLAEQLGNELVKASKSITESK
jgi:hypothetical protein